MQIGIMSDSHGDAAMTRSAVELLESRGAAKLIHCGDLCGESVLDALAGHDCIFVWGNCDHPTAALRRYVASVGLPSPDGPSHLTLDGKRIGVFHGHERDFALAVEGGGLDYIFYGHTHRFADQRVKGCRVINPGALYRARVKTAALVDLGADTAEFIDVSTGHPVSAS
jgi:hypothetical protein